MFLPCKPFQGFVMIPGCIPKVSLFSGIQAPAGCLLLTHFVSENDKLSPANSNCLLLTENEMYYYL